MDRKRLVWGAVFISALALMYGVSFGPVVFLIMKTEQKSVFPNWMETPTTVIFYPHLWACYRCEPYFDYIAWFINYPGGTYTWQDFRRNHTDKFGQ